MIGIGHTAYHNVGQTEAPTPGASASNALAPVQSSSLWRNLAAAAAAFHGYKRNNGSIPWSVVWAIAGMYTPAITSGIAVAQGFGKPASKGE